MQDKSVIKLRDQYLTEVERLKLEIGSLEDIRQRLGVSQRQLCKHLMVDPSAWTRWLKTDAPPVIYQALNWLLQLNKLNPEAMDTRQTRSKLDLLQIQTTGKIKQLEAHIQQLESALARSQTVVTYNDTIDGPVEMLFTMQDEKFAAQMEAMRLELQKPKRKKAKKKVAKKKTKKKAKKKTKKKALKNIKKRKRKS